MDIHKPKPIRNWRELLSEVGIIVLGVSIALGAEQAVQTVHERSRAAEARANIREEIARNLGNMDRRETTEACMGKKLDEVDGLIAAYASGKAPPEGVWIGVPLILNTIDGRYKAAVQSGAVSLFDDAEQAEYAQLYPLFEFYWQQSQEETRAWNDLRTLEKRPPWSAVLDGLWRSAMQRARYARFNIGVVRGLALRNAASYGIAPTHRVTMKFRAVCIPLNTPRAEALKQLNDPNVRLP